MAYLSPAEYVQYGLTVDTTDDWITTASALIDAHCRRPSLFVTEYVERMRLTAGAQSVRLSYMPLAPLGTDASKPFLETAPWLIAIFYEAYAVNESGVRAKRYYPMDSVGIATGILIAALHHAGLASLTHTPSPMAFLNQILHRPDNERPFVLLVVGYPAANARVPAITRKSLEEIAGFF